MRKEWRGFKGNKWQTEVNLRDFIQNNYTSYDGDESFLAEPTQATDTLWGMLKELQKEERAKGGVLDMETEVVSGLTAYGAAYIGEGTKDLEKVVYGFATLYICSFVLDQVVNSARQSVQFFIISNKYEEIGRHINEYPHRGVTIINATGFYTGREVKMMFVLAKKRESTIIFRLIKDIDPNAFVSQSAVIGVYGEGFDHIKVK